MSDVITRFCGPDWSWMPAKVRRDPNLTPAAKVVYSEIARRTRLSVDKDESWASARDISEECSLGRRTVHEAIAQLKERGYIEVTAQYREKDHSQTTNRYKIAQIQQGGVQIQQGGPAESAGHEVDQCEEEIPFGDAAPAKPPSHPRKTVADPMAELDRTADAKEPSESTRGRNLSQGRKIARLYDETWLPAGALPRPSDHISVLVNAAKEFRGLLHTKYQGWPLAEVLALGVRRVKTCYRAPSWMWLWGSRGVVGVALAEFLDGNWDRREKKTSEKAPKYGTAQPDIPDEFKHLED